MMNLQPGYYIVSRISEKYEGISWPSGESRTKPYSTLVDAVAAKERICREQVPNGRVLEILLVERVDIHPKV